MSNLTTKPFHISSCSIRFPSTNIRLWFQSLLEEVDYAYEELAGDEVEQPAPPPAPLPGLRPLSITIPNTSTEYEASPPTSPTGTISVPNSCPTSPNSHRVFNPYSQYRPGGSGQVIKILLILLYFPTQIAGDSFLPGCRAGGDEARAGIALEHPQRSGLPNGGWGTFHCACWSKSSTHAGEICPPFLSLNNAMEMCVSGKQQQ